MIQELLVVISCLKAQGCAQTSQAYYATHPQFNQFIRDNRDKVKHYIGPEVVAVAPIIILQASGQATFHISKHLSLQLDNNHNKSFIFHFSF